MLELFEVGVSVGPRTVLSSLDFSLAEGQVLGIVGSSPNERAALLRVLTGETKPRPGSAKLGGQELWRQPLAELARRCAYLPQRLAFDLDASVLEVVQGGRAPHRGRESRRMSQEIAELALDFTGVWALASLPYIDLSQGQQRRVQLARGFAQIWQPVADGGRLLLLDEAESAPEPSQQNQLLASARRFATRGVAVVLVLRDLKLAACHTDQLLVLGQGRMLAYAATPEVLRTGPAPVPAL